MAIGSNNVHSIQRRPGKSRLETHHADNTPIELLNSAIPAQSNSVCNAISGKTVSNKCRSVSFPDEKTPADIPNKLMSGAMSTTPMAATQTRLRII
jgi:hypothetical protein